MFCTVDHINKALQPTEIYKYEKVITLPIMKILKNNFRSKAFTTNDVRNEPKRVFQHKMQHTQCPN